MFYGLLSKNFDQGIAKMSILDYAQKNQFLVGDFFDNENLSIVKSGDVLIVPNISYFGLNLLKSLAACVVLGENGVQIHFIEQPELSICGDKLADRLATFKAMLESERGFISGRAKAGMAAAKAKGVKLGRKRGASEKVKVLYQYKNEILGYIKKEIAVATIMKLINPNLEQRLSYVSFKKYVDELRA